MLTLLTLKRCPGLSEVSYHVLPDCTELDLSVLQSSLAKVGSGNILEGNWFQPFSQRWRRELAVNSPGTLWKAVFGDLPAARNPCAHS